MSYASNVFCAEGAFNNGTYSNAADVFYAPLSGTGVGSWMQTTSMPTLTAGCLAVNGYVYCFGGGPCTPLPESDCYSPSYFASFTSSGVGSWNRTSELPTAGWAIYVAAESYIYYLGTPVFYAQVGSDGIGGWEATTNFPHSDNPSACASEGSLIYCVGATTDAVYYTQVGESNPQALVLQNPPPFPRADYLGPAWGSTGGCSVSSKGVFAGAPCFDQNIDDAVIFDCATLAATSSGCMTTVVSPSNTQYNYNITVWYPRTNSSFPETNCAFMPALGYYEPFYAWCITVGLNSFIIVHQIQMQSNSTS